MRILRLFGVIALLLLFALIALRFVPLDRLREPLNRALTSAVGRPLRIDGDIRIEVDFDSRIEIEQVSLWNLPGRAEFGYVGLEFRLLPLLRGVFEVNEVLLADGEVHSGDDGEAHAIERLSRTPRERGDLVELAPRRFSARDVRIEHRNRAGLVTTVDFERLDLTIPDPNSAIEARAVGRFDGQDFDVEAELGTPFELRGGEPFPVVLAGLFAGMELTARGAVGDPVELSGLDFTLSLQLPSLGALPGFRDKGLREIGPARASARLTDSDGLFGLEGIQIQIGDPADPLQLMLEGDLDDLDDLDEISFQLKLDADDLPVIGEIIGVTLPPIGRVSLGGRFRGSAERIESQDFSLALDDTLVTGKISGNLAPGRRPSLVARFETAMLDLDDIGIGPQAGTARPREADSPRTSANEVFHFDRLPELDARVSIRADEIVGRADLLIDSLRAEIVLTEDRLAIEGLQIDYADGAVRGSASVRTRQAPPLFALKLDARGLQMGRVLTQVEVEPSLSGLLDANIDVTAGASSWRALRSDLSGQLRFLVRDGQARSDYANVLEGDLLKAAFGANAPGKFDAVRCLIGDIQATSGIAEIAALWFETDITSIRAEGRFDLREDSYDLKLTPRPKKRGLLSYAATVTIKGPFSDPKVAPVAGSLPTSAVKGLVGALLRRADPLLKPMMTPELKKLFLGRGGETGPCAGFTPDS